MADWGRAYEQDSQNFAVELDFVRVIVIGPNRNEPGRRAGRLSSATLSYLERELAGTEKDCWVVCHWPLLRTVMGDPRLHFTSAMEAFHAKPDADIRKLLGRTPQREGLAVRPYSFAAQRPRPDQAHESWRRNARSSP